MKPNIGISDENRAKTGDMLNALLADEMVLYTKLRKFHWNVVGARFKGLHELFEEQYTRIEETVDQVAERARTIGVTALGTLAEFQEHTRLKEHPGEDPGDQEMIAEIVGDHETLIRQLRADAARVADSYGDAGTEGLLADLLEQHEEMAWMLRAHLEE